MIYGGRVLALQHAQDSAAAEDLSTMAADSTANNERTCQSKKSPNKSDMWWPKTYLLHQQRPHLTLEAVEMLLGQVHVHVFMV